MTSPISKWCQNRQGERKRLKIRVEIAKSFMVKTVGGLSLNPKRDKQSLQTGSLVGGEEQKVHTPLNVQSGLHKLKGQAL